MISEDVSSTLHVYHKQSGSLLYVMLKSENEIQPNNCDVFAVFETNSVLKRRKRFVSEHLSLSFCQCFMFLLHEDYLENVKRSKYAQKTLLLNASSVVSPLFVTL